MHGAHERPAWWDWDLELTAHIVRRMADREFSEVDLRRMLHDASSWRRGREPRRWRIETRHAGRPWVVIVEPEPGTRLLVVITAYSVE